MLWGGSFFLNELAIPLGPSSVIVLCRVAIGALGLWLLVWWKGLTVPLNGRVWFSFLVMGLLCNVLPFLLFVQAQRSLDSGVTATLNATTPLFTALIAHGFIDDERLRRRVVIAIVLAMLGVWVVSGSPVVQGEAGHVLWMPIAAALCHGLAVVLARCMVRVAPEIAAAGVLTCSTAISLVLVLWRGDWQSLTISLQPVLAVLALGVLSTSLAYLLYFRILYSAGATALSLVTVIMPISATCLGAAFLGEILDARAAMGLLLILLSLLVFNGWVGRTSRKKQASRIEQSEQFSLRKV